MFRFLFLWRKVIWCVLHKRRYFHCIYLYIIDFIKNFVQYIIHTICIAWPAWWIVLSWGNVNDLSDRLVSIALKTGWKMRRNRVFYGTWMSISAFGNPSSIRDYSWYFHFSPPVHVWMAMYTAAAVLVQKRFIYFHKLRGGEHKDRQSGD